MGEKILKIINNYGVMNQLKYFQSEVFELNEAIIKYENRDTTNKKFIIDELADVLMMLEQFRLFYDISIEDIKSVFKFKVNRQIERITKGEENE